MSKSITLETERLMIREWRVSDRDCYFMLSKDIGYHIFSLPGQFLVKNETDALEKIRKKQALFEQCSLGKFPIFEKITGQFIGTCGLEPYQLEGQHEIELGYRLLLKHWGKGYATEAANAVLKYGFSQLKLPKIIAFAMLQNSQSLKIIEKLGFRFLKTFEHADLPHQLYEILPNPINKTELHELEAKKTLLKNFK